MSTGTRIILKKGSGEPDPLDLEIAELAVDVVNGDLYTKLQSSEVKNLTDGGTGSSVHIGDTPPADPEEGQQWLEVPASGDATMWIYDGGNGGQWLEQPSSGGSGGGANYDDSWIQPALDLKADKSDLDAKANVGDSYTKSESDSTFQVKGDYIDDAPADGEMYVRKDGAWELFTPSGGGGGGAMYEPITQPQYFGSYEGTSPEQWQDMKAPVGVATFNVPAGYAFVFCKLTLQGYASITASTIYIDGIQMWPAASLPLNANGNFRQYLADESTYIVRNSLQFDVQNTGGGNAIVGIVGTFIPADSTKESAALREEYMAKEAEMIAAMPVTQEIPE